MNTRRNMSMLDAIKNLSSIIELKRNSELHLLKNKDVMALSPLERLNEIGEVRIDDKRGAIRVVRETLTTVLNYLKKSKEKGDKKACASVKNIMILAYDAAFKLDHYTDLFPRENRASELKEYQNLQEFYMRNFFKKAKIKKEKKKASFIEKIFKQKRTGAESKVKLKFITKALSTLNRVERDDQYELFYLRDENGDRFFDKKLAREIKSACNFGEYWHKYYEDDPLMHVKHWHDKNLYFTAKSIVKHSSYAIEKFCRMAMKFKEMTLVKIVNKALMSLMLAANPKNLIRYTNRKSCGMYFKDFIGFLREGLSSSQYKKLLKGDVTSSKDMQEKTLKLIHDLCGALFASTVEKTAIIKVLGDLIEDGLAVSSKSEHWLLEDESIPVYKRIVSDYEAIFALLKKHPNGPLFKALDYIMERKSEGFDPIMQDNVPDRQFDLRIGDKKVTCISMPSPTRQRFVHHAEIVEEFEGFLRDVKSHSNGKYLIFNLQDRTDWHEYARCKAIEDLQKRSEFSETLTVITLSKNGDFYNQNNYYRHLNSSKEFVLQFKEHVMSESCGFSFPKFVQKAIFPKFADKLMKAILRTFFAGKRVLTRQERLNFIDMFYFFLELKIIEIVKPDMFSFTCKDLVDVGPMSTAKFYLSLKMINGKLPLKEKEMNRIRLMLFEHALTIRERVPQLMRMSRLVHFLRDIESYVCGEFKQKVLVEIEDAFMDLYEMPIFRSKLVL